MRESETLASYTTQMGVENWNTTRLWASDGHRGMVAVVSESLDIKVWFVWRMHRFPVVLAGNGDF
jgi:hypothetical protein